MLSSCHQLSIQEKFALVEEMYATGQTHSSWCEERGINPKTMGNWVGKYKAAHAARVDTTDGWVELNTHLRPTAPTLQGRAQFRIKIADALIAVPDDFSETDLTRILRIVRTQ